MYFSEIKRCFDKTTDNQDGKQALDQIQDFQHKKTAPLIR